MSDPKSRPYHQLRETRTGSGLCGRRHRQGIVSGYLFKCIRETLGLTQERLAESLKVDKNTVQGWECGRRSLANTRLSTFVTLKHKLRCLGADPRFIDSLHDAVDADHFLEYALEVESAHLRPAEHPLSVWVIKRSFAQMLAWPFTGRPPRQFRQIGHQKRRGPVLDGPTLAPNEHERFFDHLQLAAEYASLPGPSAAESRNALLRRQAYYLSGWGAKLRTGAWLADMQHAEGHRIRQLDQWSPSWVVARSLAVSRARQGDPEPLRYFIRTGLASDECESANLNYWAYWIGETGGTEAADEFMAHGLGSWQGRTLLRRLFDNLTPTNACLDLDVHSIWSLLQRRPRLLDEGADFGDALAPVEQLLDSGAGSPQASEELMHLRYALRGCAE
jgi:DNA-binding transcriptional regulator YiaG